MDITASNGSFYLAAFSRSDWQCEWDKGDRSLSITEHKRPIHVTTYRGDFIEAVDESGNVVQDGGDGEWFWLTPTKSGKLRLRFKKLPNPKLSKEEIERARQKTEVTVVNQEQHDGGPFDFGASYKDGTLSRVVDSLLKIRNSVPALYRAKARCQIDSESGYEGSHYARIEVTYERPETDKEVIERVKLERERARLAEVKDRARLAELQAKLGENAK